MSLPSIETADHDGAYPRLSEAHLDVLRGQGQVRSVAQGAVLYRAGEVAREFLVVENGFAAILGDDDQPVSVHGPGRFLGELSLLIGQAALVTARMLVAGEVLAVPADRIRAIVGSDPALGDLILRAFLQRRSILIGLGVGLRIIGSRYSPDTRRLRDFAARNQLPHRWIDLEEDAAAEDLLRNLGVSPDQTPVVIWSADKVLRNPSNAELARAVGIPPLGAQGTVYDFAIVGAGPAGLAAAVYAASEGLTTVLLDAVAPGGQAATSSRIENYPGFPAGVSGAELAERAVIQAKKFGATVSAPAQVISLEGWDSTYTLRVLDGEPVQARTVLVATGARYRKLDLTNLERFEQAGVYYAATPFEANVCRGTPVVVVGGGNSAGQAALFLAEQAECVRQVIRGGDLGAEMSRYLVSRIVADDRIEVRTHTEVRELIGEESLEAVVVADNRTGEKEYIPVGALFVFIGAEPNTAWLGDSLALDRNGFVRTGHEVRPHTVDGDAERPYLLESSSPGVFAAGDVRSGSIKRLASAVGEGTMAVRFIHEVRGS